MITYYHPTTSEARQQIEKTVRMQQSNHGLYAPQILKTDCFCAGCAYGDGPNDIRIIVETLYKRLYDRQEMNKGIQALKEANARIAEAKRKEAELKLKLAQEQKSRKDFDQRVNSASIKIAKVLKQHGLTFGKTLTQAVPLDPTRFGDREQYSIEFKQATVVNPLSTFLTTKQINQAK